MLNEDMIAIKPLYAVRNFSTLKLAKISLHYLSSLSRD